MNDAAKKLDLFTEDAIAGALEHVRLRIAEAEHARKEAEETIGKAREEERLLNRLLALRSISTASLSNVRADAQPPIEQQSKTPAVSAVIEELDSAGRPIHVSELMRLLEKRDVVIPGAGKQANLIAHMSRDSRIVRPARGMYALASWGIQANAAEKPHRRHKRVRVTVGRRNG
jgi:hypothetical protein